MGALLLTALACTCPTEPPAETRPIPGKEMQLGRVPDINGFFGSPPDSVDVSKRLRWNMLGSLSGFVNLEQSLFKNGLVAFQNGKISQGKLKEKTTNLILAYGQYAECLLFDSMWLTWSD